MIEPDAAAVERAVQAALQSAEWRNLDQAIPGSYGKELLWRVTQLRGVLRAALAAIGSGAGRDAVKAASTPREWSAEHNPLTPPLTPPAADARWVAINETGNDNFATSIYENDYDGLLVARCNQNGNHPWQATAILRGLERNRQATPPAASDSAGSKMILMYLPSRRTEMSAALDAAAPEDEIESFLDDIYDTNIDGRPEIVRLYVARAIGRFLDFVVNSQQPISYDAMQTLRAHLGEVQDE